MKSISLIMLLSFLSQSVMAFYPEDMNKTVDEIAVEIEQKTPTTLDLEKIVPGNKRRSVNKMKRLMKAEIKKVSRMESLESYKYLFSFN